MLPFSRHERREHAALIEEKSKRLLDKGEIGGPEVFGCSQKLTKDDQPISYSTLEGFSQDVGFELSKTQKVAVLVFASSARPGGGWRNGAKAQEEDLCLSSTWGTQAGLAPIGFYDGSTKLGRRGPASVLFAQGKWLVDNYGQMLRHPLDVSFVAVAAPNLRDGACSGIPNDVLINDLATRLAQSLKICAEKGIDTFVMGAIGCGVFCWEGQDSAQALRQAVNHHKSTNLSLPNIVLAMPDPELKTKFDKVLQAPSVSAYNSKPK